MSIESDLRKEGIEVIKKLDTLTINSMATKIANVLSDSFPQYGFEQSDLFTKLARLDMYIAKIPTGKAEANYFYKNNSIYFSTKVDLDSVDSYAIHESLHYLQQIKDENNNLLRLGLCAFSNFASSGLALNEAAVQLATCKAINAKEDTVKYYDLNLPTISPTCYPLQCNLVNQMAYISGEYELFFSTFYSKDDFKNRFIALTNEDTFNLVQKNLDILIELEEKLLNYNYSLSIDEGKSKSLNKKTKNIRQKIKKLFIQTQDLIITSYFEKAFSILSNKEEIESYRRKLYNYKDVIGTSEDYFFYSNYYIQKMYELEKLEEALEYGNSVEDIETSLMVPSRNKVIVFFAKIWAFLVGERVK